MSNVRIVTDSACDLPAEVADELGIEIVPLSIRFGDEELIDREELSVAEFWNRCVNMSELPETAAPAPGQFETVFRRLADDGATGIVVVSLSGALSATIQSAELAAKSLKGTSPASDDSDGGTDGSSIDVDIRVVDSRTVTMGIGTIAIACAKAAADGASVDEVAALASGPVEQRQRELDGGLGAAAGAAAPAAAPPAAVARGGGGGPRGSAHGLLVPFFFFFGGRRRGSTTGQHPVSSPSSPLLRHASSNDASSSTGWR